jgi:prephenate dehydratase
MTIIAFQGRQAAYSDMACRSYAPDAETLPCETFADAIEAVRTGRADLGMLACENSLAGRVPDIHSLLPESGLSIIAEHFQRVEHCLLAVPGTKIEQIKRIHSHAVALGQVRTLIRELNLTPVIENDTAGAAHLVAEWNRPEDAAIASSLAGALYGLEILRANVEDQSHNTTRFYVTAAHPSVPDPTTPNLMTTFVFRVRNVPAALYKALGGFATNGVNMTRLESYMVKGNFTATQFLCDVDGHPEEPHLRRALEELSFFSHEVKILGVYQAAPFRLAQVQAE